MFVPSLVLIFTTTDGSSMPTDSLILFAMPSYVDDNDSKADSRPDFTVSSDSSGSSVL